MAQTSAQAKLAHLASSEEFLKECDGIDQELEHLRATYEQYFLGIERLAPVRMHEKLKRRMQNVKSTYNRSTSVQFRVQSLSNKFLTYQRLWDRTIREIEAGTYKRDLFKARMHAKDRSAERSQTSTAPEPPAPVAAASAPSPSLKRPPQASSAAPGELSEAKLRAVYDAYVDAKKRCREDASKISFKSAPANLPNQSPPLPKAPNL